MGGNVFSRDINIEVDPSLKQMPWQSLLKSGTCIAKRKSQLSGLTLHSFWWICWLVFHLECHVSYLCWQYITSLFCWQWTHSKACKCSRLFWNGLWVHYTWVGTINLLKKHKIPSPSGWRWSFLSSDNKRQSMANDNVYWSFDLVCSIYSLAGIIQEGSRQ